MSVLRPASSGIGVIQREKNRLITSFSVVRLPLSWRPARALLPLFSLIAIVGVLAGSAGSATSFTVVDLGTLGGCCVTEAAAVNDSGQVVGRSAAGTNEIHAFSWTQAGGMVDLGTLGGCCVTEATAVNDSGQVVGRSAAGTNEIHAFSWTQAGGMVDLGTLGGCCVTEATAVNDSGQVVGRSAAGTNEIHAFSWTQAGGMVDLGTLGGCCVTEATAVNDSGQVVGRSAAGTNEIHAFSWTQAGGMVDLGTLGGCCVTEATAVNDSGQVVGRSAAGTNEIHAFSWTQAGGMVDLGTLGGCCVTEATAVNDSGQVVGRSAAGTNEIHAFSWTQAGGMVDLGTLGGCCVTEATAVNDSGQVVGRSAAGTNEIHAFSWTQAGGMVDLGTLGGCCVTEATAVNDSGQVVGRSAAGTNEIHATLWQPVVETGSITQTASGGATITTDPANLGATADVPVQTSLSLPPDAGSMTVSITAQPSSGTPPSGFNFFGVQAFIDNGGIAANASSPYLLTFTVDTSLLGGIAPNDVQVFRDGSALPQCTDPTAASPDPCVVGSPSATSSGDALVTVRTTHFSKWNLGKLVYAFNGFLQPVDNLPVVNTTKAGSAIPVKFSLGGNKGLNVLRSGYPTQVAQNCQSGAPSDQIEQTVTAGSSSLSYDSTSNTYTYVWKTDKAWAATCRELTLRFRDGTTKKADFSFAK